MKIKQDKRRFDFHDIGLAIKRAREASGMTQEQLAYIVDRAPRTIMYNENDGQHPSLNTFYQMVTLFDISVDQYFYPSKNKGIYIIDTHSPYTIKGQEVAICRKS